MAISYPRQIPNVPIKTARMGLNVNQSFFESSFSRHVSVQSHAGGTTDQWEGMITTAPLSPSQVSEMSAWLISLKGREKYFYAYDPDRRNPKGSASTASSNPVVNGGGQVGHSVQTSGWQAAVSNLLVAGDYFQIGEQYFMVMENVTSDGSGNATITFEPAIRNSLADQVAIIFNNPVLKARLVENVQPWESDEKRMSVISFAWEEVL
mgnify:CR=1 FL=1